LRLDLRLVRTPISQERSSHAHSAALFEKNKVELPFLRVLGEDFAVLAVKAPNR
jgi:hypothetical protein